MNSVSFYAIEKMRHLSGDAFIIYSRKSNSFRNRSFQNLNSIKQKNGTQTSEASRDFSRVRFHNDDVPLFLSQDEEDEWENETV